MSPFRSITVSTWLLFIGLVVVCTSPVWGVAYFVNQDGSGHVLGSYLMGQILHGDPVIAETYVLNSLCVPNSSVHVIQAFLLLIFSAFTTTKIVVIGLFAGVVGSIGWLRFATVGNDGLKTSLLIGAAIGFNWLWLAGNYNFIFSVIVLAVTLGVYWNWRERLNAGRAFVLFLLFIAAYYSHVMGFAILAGSVVILGFKLDRNLRLKALTWTIACLLPILPLVIWYRSISNDSTPAAPVWRSLVDPYSLTSWFTQIRSADAFVLISRTAFPFVEARAAWFGIFSPSMWMIAAFTILTFVTVRRRPIMTYLWNPYFPFVVLLLISAVLAAFAPDDFGVTRGGLIRERIVICGLVFFIPIFRVRGSAIVKRTAQAILVFVVLFQTAVVWDYSIRSDRTAKEYLAAKQAMNGLRSIATVTVLAEHPRFHSMPEPQFNLFNSIGTDMIAWDNYEGGHSLFPIRMRNNADKDFALRFIRSNVFYSDDPPETLAQGLTSLDAVLADDNGRIDAMLVWGKRQDVDATLSKYFESIPYYESENIRLFHRRKPGANL